MEWWHPLLFVPLGLAPLLLPWAAMRLWHRYVNERVPTKGEGPEAE